MLGWTRRKATWRAWARGGVWPFAVPEEPLLTAVPAPPEPRDYTVVATDGSQIDVDSHGLIHCFLINIGSAAIAYGVAPDALLANQPRVHHQEEDLYAAADDGSRREVDEALLSLLRTVAELEALATLAAEWRDRPNLVAITDGNLVRWEFGGKRPDPARAALLRRYAAALARFRALGVPVCGYISRPNAREVANAASLLAVQSCDGDTSGCRSCLRRRDPLCDLLRVLPDRALLAHLRPGERSALFRSLAAIQQHYAPEDRIRFCYLHTGEEVARVELPRWACAPEHLALVQAALCGQAARGRGYPVVLMEAHEQAVIHTGGREAFRQLVQAALNGRELEASVSFKRLSKDQWAV